MESIIKLLWKQNQKEHTKCYSIQFLKSTIMKSSCIQAWIIVMINPLKHSLKLSQILKILTLFKVTCTGDMEKFYKIQ